MPGIIIKPPTPPPSEPEQPVASSSRRKPENRTLKQPLTLTVADRDDDGQLRRRAVTDKQALKSSLDAKVQAERETERWADLLMEEHTVERAVFKRATAHFQPQHYQDILHERHLSDFCSYPICGNRPQREYSSAKIYRISTATKTITEHDGNNAEGFCSKVCEIRSVWVERRLAVEPVWARSEGMEVELLEEMEERNEISLISAAQPAEVDQEEEKPTEEEELKEEEPASKDAADKVEALLSSLVIRERPTPTDVPAPPSFSAPSLSFPAAPITPFKPSANPPTPSKLPSTPSKAMPPPPELTPKTYSSTAERERARRQFNASSSLIPGLPDLSAEIISSSKALAIGAGEESDDEDNEPPMEQWEKDMDEAGKMEDEEMKNLFAQAYEARDMISSV